MEEQRALVLMSGGRDSATLAHCLTHRGWHLDAFFINYGQASLLSSLEAARATCADLSIPLTVMNFEKLWTSLNSTLVAERDPDSPQPEPDQPTGPIDLRHAIPVGPRSLLHGGQRARAGP